MLVSVQYCEIHCKKANLGHKTARNESIFFNITPYDMHFHVILNWALHNLAILLNITWALQYYPIFHAILGYDFGGKRPPPRRGRLWRLRRRASS